MNQFSITDDATMSDAAPFVARDRRAASLIPWCKSAALLTLTLLAYLPAYKAGFIWDDDAYVTENRALLDIIGLARIWTDWSATPQYYPLVHTSFWLERHAWGLNPAGYHVVNAILHGLAAIVLWRCLLLLELPLAWLAAAVFALHPIQVESVAWITERKNVLSAFFYLSAAWTYLRAALDESPGELLTLSIGWRATPRRVPRRAMYVLSVALFIAAMLSKTVSCTLPAALVLVVWAKRKAAAGGSRDEPARASHRVRFTKQELTPLVAMVLLGAPLAMLTVWLEKHHVGASGTEFMHRGWDRLLIAGRAFWFYPSKIAYPADLTFIYPRWQIDHGAPWQYAYPIAAGGAIAMLWGWSRRLGPWPLAGVLYYAGTMAPALGFFDVYPFRYSFVADHFQYLGGIGLIVLFVAILSRATRLCGESWRPMARSLLGGALLIVLGSLTWKRCGVYHDAKSLWNDTLLRNPSCWMAHNNLGNVLAREGQPDEAERHFKDAIALRPDYAEARTSLASLMIDQGRLNEARKQIDAALDADPTNAAAHYNRALCHEAYGDWDQAVEEYRRACKAQPNHFAAHYNLGVLYLRRDEPAAAEDEFKTVLKIDPSNALAHNNLGTMRARAGRIDEAIAHYRAAVRFAPENADAHRNLAIVLRMKGAMREAAMHYEKSLSLRRQARP